MSDLSDGWSAGSTYERFMGRWSRALAPRFLSWLEIPEGANWLDVGCGTGSLADAICRHARPATVVGCDPSESFIEFARLQARDSRMSFVVAGAGLQPPAAYGEPVGKDGNAGRVKGIRGVYHENL